MTREQRADALLRLLLLLVERGGYGCAMAASFLRMADEFGKEAR